jgi:hypothetical protein
MMNPFKHRSNHQKLVIMTPMIKMVNFQKARYNDTHDKNGQFSGLNYT